MFNPRLITPLLLLSLCAFYTTTATEIKLQDISNQRELQNSQEYTCTKNSDCGDLGTCNGNSRQCVCIDGVFDLDCSVDGIRLVPGTTPNKTIVARTFDLFFLDIGGESGDLTLSFGYTQPFVMILKFQSVRDFRIPDQLYNDAIYQFKKDTYVWNGLIPKEIIKTKHGQRLLILVANFAFEDGKVAIQANFSSESTIITTIMVGIAIALAAICLLMCFLSVRRKRRLRRAREAWRLRVQMRRAQAQNGGQNGALQANINNDFDEIPNQNNIFLTQEENDKFFPEKKFSDLTSKFPQQSCSICLDDFKPEVICRQLYCVHIFHSQCIQLWLKKHQDCPNCKKEMTRDAIKKHIASETKKDKKKGKNKKYEVKEEVKEEDPLVNQA